MLARYVDVEFKVYCGKHIGSAEFISWSIDNYEFLTFHPDVQSSLQTIQVGEYTDYKYLLSHALNTLNQSYHFISTDPQYNEQDLEKL